MLAAGDLAPPINFLQMRVVPEEQTPGHIPSGFVQMEDQLGRNYLVPDFMAESLESAARGNQVRESTVEEVVEVRSQPDLLLFSLLSPANRSLRNRRKSLNIHLSLKD